MAAAALKQWSHGHPWDGSRKAQGSEPDPVALLQASKQIANAEVSCVSVDMPLATTPITSRRAADTAIFSRFRPKGCAVHSPSAGRERIERLLDGLICA